jgi:putative Mn2+ efflux pump MntP
VRLDFYSIVLVAIGLAMDVFSVATVTGFILKKVTLNQASRMSVSFGSFHVVMPLIGWSLGATIVRFVADYDHWVAFLLLAFVGGRMIYGATKDTKIEGSKIFNGLNLLLFSVAVSIDALAIGLTFYLEAVAILLPVLIAGLTAVLFTLLGLFLGSKTGHLFGRNVEIIGGLILIAIGLRIVATHMI